MRSFLTVFVIALALVPVAAAGQDASDADADAVAEDEVMVDLRVRSELQSDEVEALKSQVVQAVEEGRCRAAIADAKRIVDAMFESPVAWALLGDARRCSGDKPGAVDAYRRARTLGSEDPSVLVVLEALEASFGELHVRVRLDSPLEVPRIVLRMGDETRSPDFRRGGETVFRDIDFPDPMTLVVSGLGLREAVQSIDPLAPGERRRVDVETTFVGVGSLRVGAHDASDCRVRVRSAEGPVILPGATVEVTAGRVPVFIENEFGRLEHHIGVAAGEVVDLNPLPLVPATLTVVGLPVGSVVRAYVDGRFDGTWAEAELTVGAAGSAVDEGTGVRVAPPLKMGPLMGGSGGLFLEHPRLGEAAADVSLQPGRVNATTFDWGDMDGVAGVRDEFLAWKTSQEGRASRTLGPALPPALVGIGTAVASGVLLAAGIDLDDPGLGGSAAGVGVSSGVAFGIAIGVGIASPKAQPWKAWKPDGF